jgi:hypothetical protein
VTFGRHEQQSANTLNLVSAEGLSALRVRLAPLNGIQLPILRLPKPVLGAFEPSQIGTIVGTLMDACLPEISLLLPEAKNIHNLGLIKAEGILGEREGYPDYTHELGHRMELKLLYVDPFGVDMKSPPTPREPSARLTQKVTLKNVLPEKDVLMLVAYRLASCDDDNSLYAPTIIDIGLFPMIDVIAARDHRLAEAGGVWFGNYETPCIPSKIGSRKISQGITPDSSTYGRKESEGMDFNEDTNFGKLKRIPHRPLQEFLMKHGATYMTRGTWPEKWNLARGTRIAL